jgi:hypothetical protein
LNGVLTELVRWPWREYSAGERLHAKPGMLFVRYSAGWQGDMDMPPQTLTPYADW